MKQVFVNKIEFLGEEAIRANNGHLELTVVPAWGSNLISLIDLKTGTQLLQVPDSKTKFWDRPVLFGTPILFPPNRISDGTFEYEGKKYQFNINEEEKNNHIHGFVHTQSWELITSDVIDDSVVIETIFDSIKFPHITEQFPHHFIIKMTFILKGYDVQINAEIVNNSSERFPFGFGYHTNLIFPEKTSRFSLTAEKQWILNERNLPTGELVDIKFAEELNSGMNTSGVALDDAFLSSVDKNGKNEARLSFTDKAIDIIYQADSHFKHWVVYNHDGESGFICPEPYTWITNAPNLALKDELTGLQVLEVGESKKLLTKISLTSHS